MHVLVTGWNDNQDVFFPGNLNKTNKKSTQNDLYLLNHATIFSLIFSTSYTNIRLHTLWIMDNWRNPNTQYMRIYLYPENIN